MGTLFTVLEKSGDRAWLNTRPVHVLFYLQLANRIRGISLPFDDIVKTPGKSSKASLGYARLYDGTVAADYYGAMVGIEQRLGMPEDRIAAPLEIGQLIALVDSLRTGALNASQNEAVRQLRAGMVALAEKGGAAEAVNVLPFNQEQPAGGSSQGQNAV